MTIDLLGYSPVAYGWLSVLGIGGYTLGSIVTSRITERIGIDRMVPIGVVIVAIGAAIYLALSLAGHLSVWGLFGPLFVMAFGMAILFPSTLAGSVSVYPRIAGAAAALYGFIQMMTAALTITIVGLIADGTHMPMVWVISGAVAGSVLAVVISSPGRRRSAVPDPSA